MILHDAGYTKGMSYSSANFASLQMCSRALLAMHVVLLTFNAFCQEQVIIYIYAHIEK